MLLLNMMIVFTLNGIDMISADEARKMYYGSLVYTNTIDYIDNKIRQAISYRENIVIICNIKKESRNKSISNLYSTIENVIEYLKGYGYDAQYKIDNTNNSYELIIKW